MYGRTPLLWAVLDGRRDTVRVLLEHGVDTDYPSHLGVDKSDFFGKGFSSGE
jgi:ankyrin repeat protein